MGKIRRQIKNMASSGPSHNGAKVFATVCAFMLIVFSVLIVFNYSYNNQINEIESETIDIVSTKEFDQIWTYIETLSALANDEVREVSENIIEDFNTDTDLRKIKDELDANGYSEEFYNVIRKNTEKVYFNGIKNKRNGIVIATTEGIFEDYNTYRTYTENVKFDNNIIPYEIYFKDAYNQKLTIHAYTDIKNHTESESIIVMESHKLYGTPENHELISVADYSTLKDVYLNEGIDGFRNYQFLVPVYITDNGDIFGQSDTLHGISQSTYKVILVQEFNIYDQILHHYPELIETNNDYQQFITDRHVNLKVLSKINGIVYMLCVLLIIIYFVSLYNAYIEHLESLEENRDENG